LQNEGATATLLLADEAKTLQWRVVMAHNHDKQIVSVVHQICCGLDVHKKTISACVLFTGEDGLDDMEMEEFGTFTDELLRLRDWLLDYGCPVVAMESTGVYWQPVHNILEGYVQVVLVNARHIKNVPGRKTDLADSQWLAGLLRHGLLRGSFIPPKEVRRWRDLTRLRKSYQESLADYKRLVHKLFESANIKLASVVTQLFGTTGWYLMNMLASQDSTPSLADIAAGAQGQLRRKVDELHRSVQGGFSDHHRYQLRLLLTTIQQIEKHLEDISQRIKELMAPYGSLLSRLQEMPGVSDVAAFTILSEVGPTLEAFPSSAALASWCGLCPGNNQSAGKRRSGRNSVRGHRLKTILVEVSWSAVRKSGSYFKDKFQRLRSRRGPKRAIVAIAHRLLKAVYHIIKYGQRFRDLGEDYLAQKHHERRVYALKKQANLLGYELTPVSV
jgi:transposase